MISNIQSQQILDILFLWIINSLQLSDQKHS